MTTALLLPPSTPACDDRAVGRAVGRVLIASGLCFGSANMVQWSVMSGLAPLHRGVLGISWLIAVGVFITVLMRLRGSSAPGASRAAGWSRLAVLALATSVLGLAAISAVQRDWSLMRWASCISPCLYGLAWAIASVRGAGPMAAVFAAAAFAAVAAVGLLLGTPAQYLAAACGLALFALLPGLWLSRAGRF